MPFSDSFSCVDKRLLFYLFGYYLLSLPSLAHLDIVVMPPLPDISKACISSLKLALAMNHALGHDLLSGGSQQVVPGASMMGRFC